MATVQSQSCDELELGLCTSDTCYVESRCRAEPSHHVILDNWKAKTQGSGSSPDEELLSIVLKTPYSNV